jgi:hypothetical protein
MSKHRIPRPSPALIVACIALLVALAGTSYATVLNVPKNSVGSLQLQRNAVKAAKIAPNAVRAGHVLNGSLLAEDFKPGQLPTGAKGDKGDKGDQGDKGAPGATSVTVRSADQSVSANNFATGSVSCQPGERATGGGMRATALFYTAYAMRSSYSLPLDAPNPTGWAATVYSTQSGTFRVYVLCAAP